MTYYVYILSNAAHTLYVGFTSDLPRRLYEHKTQWYRQAFTARYTFNRVVYFETFGTSREAMARERALKGWTRSRKVALIQSVNPRWKNLARSWTEALRPD